MRKEYKQMTKKEIKNLVTRIKRISDCEIKISNHAYARMRERNVSIDEVYQVFNDFSIIEFSARKDGGISALIRDKCCREQVTISINLITGTVLTVYKNYANDNHETIDSTIYNEKLNILSFLSYYKINRKLLRTRKYMKLQNNF